MIHSRISRAPVHYGTTARGNTRAVCPSKLVGVGGATVNTAPCLVVYVRPTSFDLKRFKRFCHATGIAWSEVADGAYLCAGGLNALEELVTHDSVRSWHYVIEARGR